MILIEGDTGSWAKTYVGISAEKTKRILDEFHKSEVSYSVWSRSKHETYTMAIEYSHASESLYWCHLKGMDHTNRDPIVAFQTSVVVLRATKRRPHKDRCWWPNS